MVGDLKNGRTVHSLAQLLAMFGARLNYVSPKSLQMPRSITMQLDSQGVVQSHSLSLDSVIETSDVLYVTRVQKERFDKVAEYNAVKDLFILTANTMKKVKKAAIVMHPLPRVNEIHPEVDGDRRAVYFSQVKNGLYVRMALLSLVLGKEIS